MDLQEVECEDLDWIHLVESGGEHFLNAIMNLRVP